MKKEILFTILIIFIFCESCNFSKNNTVCRDFQIQTIGKVCFNEQIDSFLSDFFNETQEDSCIYELYIDKKDRDEYQLSLMCKRSSNGYFQENYPANYTTIKDKTVFIYSGIEDFVNKNTYSTNFECVNQSSLECIHVWYYVILKDTAYVIKANSEISTNPFFPATLNGIVEFKAPE